ncbi:ribonuclease H-like domain-containing protein [Tanacetum coccineum]
MVTSRPGPSGPICYGSATIISTSYQPNSVDGSAGPTTHAKTCGFESCRSRDYFSECFQCYDTTGSATGNWNIDTGASSYLNDYVSSLSDVFNLCIYPSVSIGDDYSIPDTNSGHSVFPTPHRPLHLTNVLITHNIVKNLIFVCQFVRDNNCTVEFVAFGFSVKDFMTRRVLLRRDSTEDLYPVTKPSTIPHAFLTSQYTWHQRLGHPGSEVLRCVLSSNSITCTKEKPPILCHAYQLGKHARLPFVSSNTLVKSCFDIVHLDFPNSESFWF